jgi:acetyl esterase/lipase
MFELDGKSASLFHPDAVDAETRAYNEQLLGIREATPKVYEVGAARMREMRRSQWLATGGPSPMAVDRSIPGPAGSIPLRVFVPETVRGAYLHIHGGGFVLGEACASDQRNAEIAQRCDVAVVSVDYRLAPEDPYPAGPDDCEAAALWLVANAQAEFGTTSLLIGGESAGANLAVVTLCRLRDRHAFRGFQAANLVFGVYDMSGTPSGPILGDEALTLNQRAMEWFGEQYVPAELALRRDPDVSPLWANLAGLPPALFSVGTLDPLLDDSLFMHARWQAAGNASELAVYPGGPHGFTSHPTPIARQALERQDRFLREAVAEGVGTLVS